MTGARRLWALASGLPPEAAVWRDGSAWSQQHELTAVALERADMWGHLLAQVLGAKASDLPAPIVMRHPDRQAAEPVSKAKQVPMREFFSGLR